MQYDPGRISFTIEWPTVALLACCYVLWMAGVWLIGAGEIGWTLPLLAVLVTLHSSLQHEIIHGHPTPCKLLNTLLVFPAVGLFLPFHRFEELHVRHHHDCDLGDPHADPESPYFTEADWRNFGALGRMLHSFNATLVGRFLIGPPVSISRLVVSDFQRVRNGEWQVIWHWLLHVPALAPVIVWLIFCGVPLWAYALAAAWPGMSILMLRTFAEHKWHPEVTGRSVTVERGGIFALLFLNNHLHAAHHHSPGMAWYRLPLLSQSLESDGQICGERFGSYGDIARRWAFTVRAPLIYPNEASAE